MHAPAILFRLGYYGPPDLCYHWSGVGEVRSNIRVELRRLQSVPLCATAQFHLFGSSAIQPLAAGGEKTGAISISNTFTYITILSQASYCWEQTVLIIYLPACCSPVSFGSTLLRYFSNIVVSFLRTSLAWLQQKYRANVRYTSQSNRRKVYRLSSG